MTMSAETILAQLAALPGVISFPPLSGNSAQLLYLSKEGGIAGTGGEYAALRCDNGDVSKPGKGYLAANWLTQSVSGRTLDAMVANRMAAAHNAMRTSVKVVAIDPQDGDIENRLIGALWMLAQKFQIGVDFQVYVRSDGTVSLDCVRRMRAIFERATADRFIEFSYFELGKPNHRERPYPVRADILYDFNLPASTLPTTIKDYHNALRPPASDYDGGEAIFLVRPSDVVSLQTFFSYLYINGALDIVSVNPLRAINVGVAHMLRVNDRPIEFYDDQAARAQMVRVHRLWRLGSHYPLLERRGTPAFAQFIEGAEALLAQNGVERRLTADGYYEAFRRLAPAIYGGMPVFTAVAVAFGNPDALKAVKIYGDDWASHVDSLLFADTELRAARLRASAMRVGGKTLNVANL